MSLTNFIFICICFIFRDSKFHAIAAKNTNLLAGILQYTLQYESSVHCRQSRGKVGPRALARGVGVCLKADNSIKKNRNHEPQ